MDFEHRWLAALADWGRSLALPIATVVRTSAAAVVRDVG